MQVSRQLTLDEIYAYAPQGLVAEITAARMMGQEACVFVVTEHVLGLINNGNSVTLPLIGGGVVALILESQLLAAKERAG